jgi:hypothetical protein
MRIYQPDIGRFGSVDLITNQYTELTPYQFASNRPIDGVDLDGLEYFPFSAYDLTDKQIKLVHEEQVKMLPTGLTFIDVNDAAVLATWISRGRRAIKRVRLGHQQPAPQMDFASLWYHSTRNSTGMPSPKAWPLPAG